MTHEFKKIIEAYKKANTKGISAVLATVVALEGSSYRRPGVFMLIQEDGTMVGAVSGGCVEKEVFRQSETVFRTGQSKMMIYDGRYRLGCEGILYILIESFAPTPKSLLAFEKTIRERRSFELISAYSKNSIGSEAFGTHFKSGIGELPFSPRIASKAPDDWEVFSRILEPCFKLMIIGAEHDAVQLSTYAALTGWEVTVVASPSEEKHLKDFPGALELLNIEPENLPMDGIDKQTAVVVMTHSYIKDLGYLTVLKNARPSYLGLLGPLKRREKLLGELMERDLEIADHFLESIHGPTGLDIGAETPQEIAIAILAEILSVIRSKEPMKLKNKEGAIHS